MHRDVLSSNKKDPPKSHEAIVLGRRRLDEESGTEERGKQWSRSSRTMDLLYLENAGESQRLILPDSVLQVAERGASRPLRLSMWIAEAMSRPWLSALMST